MHKNALIILAVCIVLILAGAYLVFYHPVQAPTSQTAYEQEVPFSVLASGTSTAGASVRKNVQLTSESQLASAWTAVHGAKAKPPSVDFATHQVLAIFDGAHQTTGYAVSVSRIIESNGTRIVAITHAEPDRSCKVKKATTTPFQFVVVPASDANLTHIDQEATVACN